MKKLTILAMFIALVSSFSLQANEIVINRMHIWKDGVAVSYLLEADLDSITFSQEIIQEAKDITVKAKVPAAWTNVITAWVWPTDGEGKEVVLTKEGDWYVVTEHCVELNLIIKNGEGWDGYVRQEASVDITGIRENVCLVLESDGASKASYVNVDCEDEKDPDETEGANDYMLDSFKIGGYAAWDLLGDLIAGTDTLLTMSTGDEVTCQLALLRFHVWDDGITLTNNGFTGAGYFFSVETFTYVITDSPNGKYNGYFILGSTISGFNLAVDTIADGAILPYTGKAGQLLDVNMYGDALDRLYNLAETATDEEYNAIMAKYYGSQTGIQFYYYDFNTGAQSIYSGNVSYLRLREDADTGELYYDLKLEWYDHVNEGRRYGLKAETEVNEEGDMTVIGIVKPYDMRVIHKQYQVLPPVEDPEESAEAPAKAQRKAKPAQYMISNQKLFLDGTPQLPSLKKIK